MRIVRASSSWGLLAISSSHEVNWAGAMVPFGEVSVEDEIVSFVKLWPMSFSLSSEAAGAAVDDDDDDEEEGVD